MSLRNIWDARVIRGLLSSLGITTAPKKLLLSQYLVPSVDLGQLLLVTRSLRMDGSGPLGNGDFNIPLGLDMDELSEYWLLGFGAISVGGLIKWGFTSLSFRVDPNVDNFFDVWVGAKIDFQVYNFPRAVKCNNLSEFKIYVDGWIAQDDITGMFLFMV